MEMKIKYVKEFEDNNTTITGVTRILWQGGEFFGYATPGPVKGYEMRKQIKLSEVKELDITNEIK